MLDHKQLQYRILEIKALQFALLLGTTIRIVARDVFGLAGFLTLAVGDASTHCRIALCRSFDMFFHVCGTVEHREIAAVQKALASPHKPRVTHPSLVTSLLQGEGKKMYHARNCYLR